VKTTEFKKYLCKPAYLTDKNRTNPDSGREYYIFYKWTQKDTNKKGRYIGEFSVILENGELIAPISFKFIHQHYLTFDQPFRIY